MGKEWLEICVQGFKNVIKTDDKLNQLRYKNSEGRKNMSIRFSQNFDERLKFHGVQEPLQKSVSIDKETVWDDHTSPFETKLIRTNDLDEIKRLIGNDDKYFEDGSFKLPEMNLAVNLKEITHDNVKLAASAYVFGNSQEVKHLKSDIEKTIGSATIQLAAPSEVVISAPLIIKGGEIKKLEADILTLKDNGQIYCEGTLAISAGLLRNLKK